MNVLKLTNKKGTDRSFFAVERRRRKRNIKIFVPVAALAIVAIIAGVSYLGIPGVNHNQMVMHNHAKLKITVDGQPIIVPSHIGMTMVGTGADPLLYGDHSLDKYGMQGMSPLHTHDDTGIIHVESNAMRNFTLGEFFDIWKGAPNTDGKTVEALVDGKQISDYRSILLKDGESINLVIK